jgi:hypothetical protein
VPSEDLVAADAARFLRSDRDEAKRDAKFAVRVLPAYDFTCALTRYQISAQTAPSSAGWPTPGRPADPNLTPTQVLRATALDKSPQCAFQRPELVYQFAGSDELDIGRPPCKAQRRVPERVEQFLMLGVEPFPPICRRGAQPSRALIWFQLIMSSNIEPTCAPHRIQSGRSQSTNAAISAASSCSTCSGLARVWATSARNNSR